MAFGAAKNEGGKPQCRCFVLVLNREEFLEPLLEEMLKQNIGGATILESTGMMRVLDGDHNI